MSNDYAQTAADDLNTATEMRRRHGIAVGQYDTLGNTGLLRAIALTEFPDLLAIAERGIAARLQLEAQADLAIRAQDVRRLHPADDLGAGLIVCAHCSYGIHLVRWPCPTTQALDGIEAP